MDNLKLSSSDLINNSNDQSLSSKLQDDFFNLVKEYPVETMVGVTAIMAAGTIGIFKQAAREAAQIAAAKLETEGIGNLIKLGAKDAGKLTEAKVGDVLEVNIQVGKHRPYPGFSTDGKGVLQLWSGGFGDESTLQGIFKVVAAGDDVAHIVLPSRHFDFPVKARNK